MKKRQLYVDARTKIFLMLVMNIVLLNTGSGAFLSCLRFVIGFLPGIMFLLIRRYKTAGLYTAIYAGSYFIMEYVLASVSGIAAILLGFLASMGTRFLPGGMLGVYFFCSTRVNEFVASMERMHIPQKVIIPISVMFRFFPTVKEEAQGIRDAMRMRKIGFSNPAQILEYHLVPLMISVVNIGEDRSVCVSIDPLPWTGKGPDQYIPLRIWISGYPAVCSRKLLFDFVFSDCGRADLKWIKM